MKFLLTALFVFLSSNLFAEELICDVKQSLEEVSLTQFEVNAGSIVSYDSLDGFVFSVANLGNAKFELDVFDPNGPSRSYANGHLRTHEDSIGWTYWTRDTLIETNCRLR